MNFFQGLIINWVDSAFTVALTIAGVWGGRYFKKSKALKTADDELGKANMLKEWVSAIDTATGPFKDEIAHMRLEFKELQGKYIDLSIQVGVLTKENDRKDIIIRELETENRGLRTKIQEYEAIKLRQAYTNSIENIG